MEPVIKCEDILKENWCAFETPGMGQFYGHWGNPKQKSAGNWGTEESKEKSDAIIQAGGIIEIYWPILIKKVDMTREAYIAIFPPPDKLDKTIFQDSCIRLNTRLVTYWAPIFPLKNDSVLKYFKAYFEAEVNRIAVAKIDEATLRGMPIPGQKQGKIWSP